ncbi:MAG TPA: hypothetical protein ENJ32_12765 [Crenotrichaceae bacterium]|nr:hypothetical protein [Crenotrichaceae bacterium]
MYRNVLKKTLHNNKVSHVFVPKAAMSSTEDEAFTFAMNKRRSGVISTKSATQQDQNKIAEEAAILLNQIATADNLHDVDSASVNRRKAIRYTFEGIEFSLKLRGLTGRWVRIPIKVVNISGRGALVECNKQLRLRPKVVLKFQYSARKSFNLSAKITRKEDENLYSLAFEKRYHGLIDVLMSIADSYDIAW